jgi:chromosome condensin MukBEF complex kleisin-like MukF subunit
VGHTNRLNPDPGLSRAVHDFVARVLALTDDERRAIADARAFVDESFHRSALLAAAEQLVSGSDEYARARTAVAVSHVPAALEHASPDELEELNRVARHVQLAIDDGLLAVLTRDTLHPKHLRELNRSLGAAFDR